MNPDNLHCPRFYCSTSLDKAVFLVPFEECFTFLVVDSDDYERKYFYAVLSDIPISKFEKPYFHSIKYPSIFISTRYKNKIS